MDEAAGPDAGAGPEEFGAEAEWEPAEFTSHCSSVLKTAFALLAEDDDNCLIEDTLEIIKDGEFQGEIMRFKTGGHRFVDENSITALRDVINNYIPCFD